MKPWISDDSKLGDFSVYSIWTKNHVMWPVKLVLDGNTWKISKWKTVTVGRKKMQSKNWVNQFWDDDDVASVKAYKLEKKIWSQKFLMKNKID